MKKAEAEPTEEQKSAMSYLSSVMGGAAKAPEPESTEPEEKPAGSMMEALGLATKEEPETEEPPPTLSECRLPCPRARPASRDARARPSQRSLARLSRPPSPSKRRSP